MSQGRSEERKMASHKRILDAAGNLFGRKGYHATTIDDITRAAGISRGSMYWHFESKSELLAALLDVLKTDYLDRFMREAIEGQTSLERLWKIFKFNARFAVEHTDLVHCIRTLSLELAESEDHNMKALHDLLRKQHEFISGIIRDGQSEGWIRRDFSPEIMTAIILALHDGIVLQLSVFGNLLKGRDVAWAFKQITLAGMKAGQEIIHPKGEGDMYE